MKEEQIFPLFLSFSKKFCRISALPRSLSPEFMKNEEKRNLPTSEIVSFSTTLTWLSLDLSKAAAPMIAFSLFKNWFSFVSTFFSFEWSKFAACWNSVIFQKYFLNSQFWTILEQEQWIRLSLFSSAQSCRIEQRLPRIFRGWCLKLKIFFHERG